MRRASIFIPLLFLLTGCANLLNMPPPHVGDQVLGALELSFVAPVGYNGAETAITMIVDLRKRTWPGLRNPGTIRYLQYTLVERRLHLVLEDETRMKVQGGMTVAYDEHGNMIGFDDPKRNRLERMILVIEGEFEIREGDTIGGVFTGTIQQEYIRGTYDRRTQRWTDNIQLLWQRELSGALMKEGKQVDRLSVRHRR